MQIKYAPIALSMLTSLTFGQSLDCQKQQQNQTVFNMCNVTVGPTASPNIVVGPSSTAKIIGSNTESGVTGQVGNATVVGPESIQAQQKQTALIEMVRKAPTPEVTNEWNSFTFGEIERKIFSCQEMSLIRYWAKNPGNTVGKQVVGETGLIRGVVDSYGWYEVPFTIADSSGKEITAFGGASASRQAVYKNGAFHHWSGWPKDDGTNNLAPGWGWNFAQIGLCESSI